MTVQDLNITNNSSSVIQFSSGAGNFLTVACTNTFEVLSGGNYTLHGVQIIKDSNAGVNVGGGVDISGDWLGTYGDIKIIDAATVVASSAHGLALDNRL